MPIALLLSSTLALLSAAPQLAGPAPPPHEPLSNTFTVAAETVIDDGSAVDLKADDAHFDGQMKTLKTAKQNLDSMASDDHEHDVATSLNDMIFLISACHIQARNGAPTATCEGQISNAQQQVMLAIGKHKSGGAWVDGAPS